MIIIWQRWGILVVLFFLVGILLGYLIRIPFTGTLLGTSFSVFIGIGWMISAVALYFVEKAMVGKIIDKPKPAIIRQQLAEPVKLENGSMQTHRVVPITDPDTGQQLWIQPKSTLFFIPVKYWSYILGGIGLLTFAVNLLVLLALGA